MSVFGKFVSWLGQTIYAQAETEITDESVIHDRLLDLQTQFELEKISEDEFLKQESALMRRLNEIHKYKEAKQKA